LILFASVCGLDSFGVLFYNSNLEIFLEIPHILIFTDQTPLYGPLQRGKSILQLRVP
jgi:hypothetical protein